MYTEYDVTSQSAVLPNKVLYTSANVQGSVLSTHKCSDCSMSWL